MHLLYVPFRCIIFIDSLVVNWWSRKLTLRSSRRSYDNATRTSPDALECRLNGTLQHSQNATFIDGPKEDREVPRNVSDLLSLRSCRKQLLILMGSLVVGLTLQCCNSERGFTWSLTLSMQMLYFTTCTCDEIIKMFNVKYLIQLA